MIKLWIKKLFGGGSSGRQLAMVAQDQRSDWVRIEGVEPFEIIAHLYGHEGLPIPDWKAIERWVDSLPESKQLAAWHGCVRAWLLHMRDALGDVYTLVESDRASLVSPWDSRTSASMAKYMERTMHGVLESLPRIAMVEDDWRPILIAFADQNRYYDYISLAYPEHGEFGFSSGMFLRVGPGHFVTYIEDSHRIDPIIAHEMTHACLAHLEIPLWLNEGLAVNTEHRLVGATPSQFGPLEMHARHVEFWNADTIQGFWSGQAFHRSDDGMMLSYDLARILVKNMAQEWEPFAAFVNDAYYEDAGDRSARQHLHLDLGASVAALFGGQSPADWAPNIEAMKEAAGETA